MPRRRDLRPRVLGPTWLKNQEYFRVVVITPEEPRPEDRRVARYYRDAPKAQTAADKARERLKLDYAIAVEDAITEYEQHLTEKGTIGRAETIRRLRAFFRHPKECLRRIKPERAGEYYDAFRLRTRADGTPISVAYHRAALINARSFLRWCIKQGWLSSNPLAEVEGVGRRNAGKEQHTGSETQHFYRYCLERAQGGDEAALAVLMALLMALRSGDITRRTVRDLDLDASVLRVWNGKTKASNKPRRVPLVLRPMLRTLAHGRTAFEPLFKSPRSPDGHHTRRWLYNAMARLCAGADVPFVCTHALKGTSGTLAAELGDTADRIAEHLSHEETTTQRRHYVAAGVAEEAQAARAFEVIAGGKRP